MPTRKQETNFSEFIADELKPSTELMGLEPEEVFQEKKLQAWAEANGYIKE